MQAVTSGLHHAKDITSNICCESNVNLNDMLYCTKKRDVLKFFVSIFLTLRLHYITLRLYI